MHYLIYTSRSTLPTLPESAWFHLLSECAANNRAQHITSVIAYRDGVFIGYMEGDKPRVTSLFQKILEDPRHMRCELVKQGWHRHRWFSHIYMGYLNMDETAAFSNLFQRRLGEQNYLEIIRMYKTASQHPEYIQNRGEQTTSSA